MVPVGVIDEWRLDVTSVDEDTWRVRHFHARGRDEGGASCFVLAPLDEKLPRGVVVEGLRWLEVVAEQRRRRWRRT